MKEIKLTQNKVALIDDDDFEYINQFKWNAHRSEKYWYASRSRGVRMHRVIMKTCDGMDIDHKNGNGLDNRKENLRICTHQQNMQNQPLPRINNKLGVKGVSLEKGRRKNFRATIFVKGKKVHLGYYNVLKDADEAYRIAEKKYFGDFSRNTTNVN